MKKILIIFTVLFLTKFVYAEVYDQELLTFESVQIKEKSITLSGNEYSYSMSTDSRKDSYLTENYIVRSLKYLRKGEKVYVAFRVIKNDDEQNSLNYDSSKVVISIEKKSAEH